MKLCEIRKLSRQQICKLLLEKYGKQISPKTPKVILDMMLRDHEVNEAKASMKSFEDYVNEMPKRGEI